jgi:prepilin-type N-terminal cleavage/methylation domain-containing protein/prepilin-type processing-associated H-X9-DG protein
VRRAFTLIELLVVIGVVGLLLAILMPTLHRARMHAERVQCLGNLRQIGAALVQYDVDFKRLPRPAQLGVEEPDDWNYWQRGRVFEDGAVTKHAHLPRETYSCPSDGDGNDKRAYQDSYSVSSELCRLRWTGQSLRLARVNKPSDTAMAFCEASNAIDDGCFWVPDGGYQMNRLSTRHDKRGEGTRDDDGWGNVAFADGHVDRVMRSQAYEAARLK